jgi:hypothetical protein
MIDPPWQMEEIDRDELPNQDSFERFVMTITE